jgi:hypothetical protein
MNLFPVSFFHRLLGVPQRMTAEFQATKGILVTTSAFTGDALKYLEVNGVWEVSSLEGTVVLIDCTYRRGGDQDVIRVVRGIRRRVLASQKPGVRPMACSSSAQASTYPSLA